MIVSLNHDHNLSLALTKCFWLPELNQALSSDVKDQISLHPRLLSGYVKDTLYLRGCAQKHHIETKNVKVQTELYAGERFKFQCVNELQDGAHGGYWAHKVHDFDTVDSDSNPFFLC